MIPGSGSMLITASQQRFIDIFGTPLFAYSTRLLNSDYAGKCLRARRDSDNTEQDIGFSDGILDESALTTFVGANNGYVKTWYDQSGNANDATQTTTSEQPQIVVAGTVYKESGFVSLKSPATTSGMSTGITGIGNKTILALANTTAPASAASQRVLTSYSGGGSVGNELLIDHQSTNFRYFDGGTNITANYAAGWRLIYANRKSSQIALAINGGTAVTSTPNTSTNANAIKLYEEGGSSSDEVPTSITEVIFYNSDLSSQRADMETEINDFYSIY